MKNPATLSLLAILSFSCSTGSAPSINQMDWNRYYNSSETASIMRNYARRYPNLARITKIGESYKGKDLLVMEISNRSKGDPAEKPALYVDGNIHSGELTGSSVTLYLMGHLLEGYGDDPGITALLDSRTFYLRPKFNPDGADLALEQDLSARSTIRPYDNDGDGQKDEDPEDDLNGDGFITQMRILDEDGSFMVSRRDPRVLLPRTEGATGPFFNRMTEGIDNDGDGRFNEDGHGGLDMNRNFPRNWALTYKQPGAGSFPLSEPETYATVKFIDAHPNITGIVHNHTAGGFVYRLPSASDPALFNKNDLSLIELLGAEYTRDTGRPVRPSSTHATNHRYGTLISWAYWDRGIIGWVPEYWPGLGADLEGTAEAQEMERLRIDDENLGGAYFVEWTNVEHPQLGQVEVGGWRTRFTRQNPPAEMLHVECAMQIPWILYLARQSPMLEMQDLQLQGMGDGRFELKAGVHNIGFMPTNLTERGKEAEVVPPVYAIVELEGAELVEGRARLDLGHLAGSHQTGDRPRSAEARWVLRGTESHASVQVTFVSAKGGSVRSARLDLSAR